MPSDRSQYHPKWELISYLIRKRAQNRCEWCGAENNSIIYRNPNRKTQYRPANAAALDALGELIRTAGVSQFKAMRRLGLTRVILATAHLDRNRQNNRFRNLAALCQRCHLVHDLPQHIRNRNYGIQHDRQEQIQLFRNGEH